MLPNDFEFSFSSLTSFEQCPMMFKLEKLDNVPQSDNAFAQYGSWCHNILERWAKNELPDFLLASEYESGYSDNVCVSFPPYPKGLAGKYYTAGKEYFESFSGFGENYDILGAEEKFRIEIAGNKLVGIVDLILQDKDTGDIVVIDHKSKSNASMKKELLTYRRQLYIYAGYINEKYGKFPSKMIFNMLKEGTTIEEEFDKTFYEDTICWVVDCVERMKHETEFKPKPDRYFCEHICGVSLFCDRGNG